MKRIIAFSLLLTFVLAAFAQRLPQSTMPPKRELRSAWVSTVWGIDWPKQGAPAERQKAELVRMLDSLKNNNFNAINLQVRSMSDAFYQSSYEPWSSYLTGTRGKHPGYDPLAFAVSECHKRGMEIHAWINPYRFCITKMWNTERDLEAKRHLLRWGKFYILDPAQQWTIDRIVNVCREVVTKYDIDGILYDDYFYPNGIASSVAAPDYKEWKNSGTDLSIGDWRRDNVNRMVKAVYNMIQREKPWVRFGISPAGVACTSQSLADKYGIDPCPSGSDWQYNGHLYGIPHSIEAACMTYNKTLIDELGQVVPKTREEYESLCNAAQEAGYLPISFGYSGNTIFNGWAWDHYIATYAGVEKEKQLLKGEITFNDPEIRASFEQLKADWDKGWINDKKSGAISLDEARALFSNGKAAMNMEGGWSTLADNLQKNWDFEWGQTEWPSMKNGTPPSAGISIGEYIGINAKSKYADLCAEMMCDFYMDEQRVADAVSNGFSTPCREIDPNLYPEDMDPGIKQALEYQNELLGGENLSYHAFSFWPSKTLNYLNDNLDKLFYDQISMDDFLNQAQEKIETDFDNGYSFKG